MQRALNVLSWLAIGLLAFAIGALCVAYTQFVNRPMRGGWNEYRVREFLPQLLPYVLLLLGLVITRTRNCPRALFYLGMTLVLLCGAYLCLLYFALNGPVLPALLVLAVGGHIAYLAKRGVA